MKNKVINPLFLLFCLFVGFLLLQSCTVYKRNIEVKRTFCFGNDYPIYLDPYVTYSDTPKGLGLLLLSDSFLVEYYFKDGYRYQYDYGGDIIVDTIRWFITEDTLTIGNYYQYRILKCRNDSLEVLDIIGTAIRPKVLFIKSEGIRKGSSLK